MVDSIASGLVVGPVVGTLAVELHDVGLAGLADDATPTTRMPAVGGHF